MESAKTAVERLFSLVATVMELVRDGERDAEEVCDVLQVIKDQKYFMTNFRPQTKSELVNKQLAVWTEFYREEFGITLNISEIQVPKHQEGFDRLIMVAQSLTAKRIYRAMKKKMPARKNWRNLNNIESIRKTDKTYAVWVRDRQEADEDLNCKSANYLKRDAVNCITLEEYLLLAMMYFQETGKHLDIQNTELCAGSHRRNGSVWCVSWDGDKGVCVSSCDPDRASEDIGSRSVVSA